MASHHTPATTRVLHATIFLGALVVVFIWALFLYQSQASRRETLNARLAEHRNLALITSESIRQMTDRAAVIAGFAGSEGQESESQGSKAASSMLPDMLAEDPLFNRLTRFRADGTMAYATHREQATARGWLADFLTHEDAFGQMPMIPRRSLYHDDEGADNTLATWRLPVVVPASEGRNGGAVVLELDVGYLVGLLQHVALGTGTFVQILDSDGAEWIRADSGGVIGGGRGLAAIPVEQAMPFGAGAGTVELAGEKIQRVWVSRRDRGFSVVVNQPHAEILAPLRAGQSRQMVLNLLMTMLVSAITIWLKRSLTNQHKAFSALEAAQKTNHELIERLEVEHARSSRAASIDHLSGLLNRRQFIETANRLLLEQRRRRQLTAMIYLDLDRFKTVNDSLGHQVGDLLLQAVAGRIQRMLGPGDLAARFGGDEFVVMLAGERSEEAIEHWVAAFSQKLSAIYQLDGVEVHNSPSVGIAICPRDMQTLEELLQAADAAMYSAKKAGRGQYRFFDQSLNRKDVEGFLLEQSFAESLGNREFVLHYQPQVDLESMRVVSLEALVRWQHPELGLLFPDRFIAQAESSGFILPLGLEVIRLACEQMVCWRESAQERLPVAVNVSPHQLAHPEFLVQVLDILSTHGVSPHLLELEITETAILDEQAVSQLDGLSQAGIRLALDDFGTGYAGFAHLKAVPVSKLKIDRSLISTILNSHDDSPIVSSTITLAKRMKLEVVAEGVETREQLVHLKVAGCDMVQGYHLGRPMPADELPGFLDQFHHREAMV